MVRPWPVSRPKLYLQQKREIWTCSSFGCDPDHGRTVPIMADFAAEITKFDKLGSENIENMPAMMLYGILPAEYKSGVP